MLLTTSSLLIEKTVNYLVNADVNRKLVLGITCEVLGCIQKSELTMTSIRLSSANWHHNYLGCYQHSLEKSVRQCKSLCNLDVHTMTSNNA